MPADWEKIISEFDSMTPHDQLRAVNKAQIEWIAETAESVPSLYALDLGFGCGISAATMTMAGCEVSCVNNEPADTPRRIEAQKRYKRICGTQPHIIAAPSDRALPRLLDEEREFGLIFVDAGHRVDDVFIDVHYAASLCASGGVLALDDTYYAAIRVVTDWVNTNMAHIWEPLHILENTVSWRRTDFMGDDSKQGGMLHRTHSGPPAHFDIATENADEFMFYPRPPDDEHLGFAIWHPSRS